MDKGLRLTSEDTIIGMDLGSRSHQVVVIDGKGKRLTSFRIGHSREGLTEMVRRVKVSRAKHSGRVTYGFEATGHFWEAVAHFLAQRGLEYVVINPLVTFRVREARQMSREKTDLTDAEQIAELIRSGLVTRTQLEKASYIHLKRVWGEYDRLREERARLKTRLCHQLYGLFPEILAVWSDVLQPGCLAVLRSGLTPRRIAKLSRTRFLDQAKACARGRRLWRFKVFQVHQWAGRTVAPPQGAGPLAREIKRMVDRIDVLTDQVELVKAEIESLLETIEEARYLRTIPGLAWVTIAGLIAHIGDIDKFRHGRQLIKLAGTNPSRNETGLRLNARQRMTHRGRSGLRQVVFMATISCLQHNPRIRAHYDRLIKRSDRPLPKMVAVGACMNKLLLYAFAVMKRRQAFDVNHRWEVHRLEAA